MNVWYLHVLLVEAVEHTHKHKFDDSLVETAKKTGWSGYFLQIISGNYLKKHVVLQQNIIF